MAYILYNMLLQSDICCSSFWCALLVASWRTGAPETWEEGSGDRGQHAAVITHHTTVNCPHRLQPLQWSITEIYPSQAAPGLWEPHLTDFVSLLFRSSTLISLSPSLSLSVSLKLSLRQRLDCIEYWDTSKCSQGGFLFFSKRKYFQIFHVYCLFLMIVRY